MKVLPYLAFSGECQEAINFYAKCLNAEVTKRISFEDAKMDIPTSYRSKLQHAEVKGKGVHFFAYDAAPDTPLNNGNKIHMSVDVNDAKEAEKIFNELSSGGQINEPFNEKHWGALYGRCTDKFGVHWMVNSDL